MNAAQATEIRCYLETGQHDELGGAWPGRTIVESMQNARAARRAALCTAVQRQSAKGTITVPALDQEPQRLVRDRVAPMVRGLFPAGEQDIVLALLEHSLCVLTPANIEAVLTEAPWDHTAWSLANLYLGSIGAPLLAPDAPRLLGLSAETTCYLAVDTVARREPFVDVLVHEAAHVFHNCKRRTVGLPATRVREWLLLIDFRKRETFAYACEAYSAILRDASSASERRTLGAEFAAAPSPAEERVEPGELVDIVREACDARNGWKRILAGCAPLPAKRASPRITNVGTAATGPNDSQYSLVANAEIAGEEKTDG